MSEVSFKPKISSKHLKTIINSLHQITDEARLRFSPENGLEVNVISPDHIAYAHFQFPPTEFTEWICNSPITIESTLTELQKVIKSSAKDEMIEISLPQENKMMLKIMGPKYTNPIKVNTVDMRDEEPQNPPRLDFPAKIKIVLLSFKRAIDDCSVSGNSVAFRCDQNSITFSSKSEISEQQPTFNKRDHPDVLLDLRCSTPVLEVVYPLIYVQKILENAKDLTDIVTLEFGDNLPLHIDFELINIVLEYWIAPRFKED